MELNFGVPESSTKELMLSNFLFFKFIGRDDVGKASRRLLVANALFARLRYLAVADWLVSHQRSEDGAWPVGARRYFTSKISLQPGWCSAMGQGRSLFESFQPFGWVESLRRFCGL